MDRNKLKLRRAQSQVYRLFTDCSHCLCCGMPWDHCQAHYTEYAPGRSCFPLCDWCWPRLNVEERLVYYHSLVLWWQVLGDDREVWEDLEKAVRAGK